VVAGLEIDTSWNCDGAWTIGSGVSHFCANID
jgi:hypothetical protein